MLTCRTVLVRVDQPAQGEGIHGQFFLAILAVCELANAIVDAALAHSMDYLDRKHCLSPSFAPATVACAGQSPD